MGTLTDKIYDALWEEDEEFDLAKTLAEMPKTYDSLQELLAAMHEFDYAAFLFALQDYPKKLLLRLSDEDISFIKQYLKTFEKDLIRLLDILWLMPTE